MNIKSILITLLTTAVLLLVGCSDNRKQTQIDISVSIEPIKGLVDIITSNSLKTGVIVPSGTSPETFSPTPSQVARLRSSKAVITLGTLNFEKDLLDQDINKATGSILDLTNGIELIEGKCNHSSHKHAHSVDPHTWLSPQCLIVMVDKIANYLVGIYPDSVNFRSNADTLIRKIELLQNCVKQKIETANIKQIFIYHPALTYYAREFGLKQLSIEQEGKDASMANVKEFVDNARKSGCKHIFYQKEYSGSVVESVANEAEVPIAEIDPLSYNILSEIERITELICE